MEEEGSNDRPVNVYCTLRTTIADIRKKVVGLCQGRPGFLGDTDIKMWLGEDKKKRLFAAMSFEEAGLSNGAQLMWTCIDRSGQGDDAEQKESARAKRARLEAEFGDGKVRDPCDDGGFWKGGMTKNLKRHEDDGHDKGARHVGDDDD